MRFTSSSLFLSRRHRSKPSSDSEDQQFGAAAARWIKDCDPRVLKLSLSPNPQSRNIAPLAPPALTAVLPPFHKPRFDKFHGPSSAPPPTQPPSPAGDALWRIAPQRRHVDSVIPNARQSFLSLPRNNSRHAGFYNKLQVPPF